MSKSLLVEKASLLVHVHTLIVQLHVIVDQVRLITEPVDVMFIVDHDKIKFLELKIIFGALNISHSKDQFFVIQYLVIISLIAFFAFTFHEVNTLVFKLHKTSTLDKIISFTSI
jgi:hypothetical protein